MSMMNDVFKLMPKWMMSLWLFFVVAYVGIVVFIIWVIVKILQHFHII